MADSVPVAFGRACKLTLNFNANPGAPVCGIENGLSHETAVAKANAAAATCRVRKPVPEYEEFAVSIKERVYRSKTQRYRLQVLDSWQTRKGAARAGDLQINQPSYRLQLIRDDYLERADRVYETKV